MDPNDQPSVSIKRFIETQIRPGEKYDYHVIQQRFNRVLAKKDNEILRNYRLILEKVNKSYQQMASGQSPNISTWYLGKLKEFIAKYRQLHSQKSHIKMGEISGTMDVDKLKSRHPNRYIPGVPMRGNYYQQAGADEFGCVLVCD